MGVRTAIDVDYRGVLPGGIEVVGLHHTIIKIGGAVGGLDAPTLKDGLLVASPGVGGCEQIQMFTVGGIRQVDVARNIGGRELIIDLLS